MGRRRDQDIDPILIDGPIHVTQDDPGLYVALRVLVDSTLSDTAFRVAALWFYLEREPTVDEIREHLGLDAARAGARLNEVRNCPSMREYI